MRPAGHQCPDPAGAHTATGIAIATTVALVAVGLLGIGGCSIGPRTASVPSSHISNAALGQDVPDDQLPAAPPAVVRCADLLHQNRPGGSDYNGPPVPGCQRAYW
jgi:hypothetical protein